MYNYIFIYKRGANIFQKSKSHVKILGIRNVTLSKFHSEVQQISPYKIISHSDLAPPNCIPLVYNIFF